MHVSSFGTDVCAKAGAERLISKIPYVLRNVDPFRMTFLPIQPRERQSSGNSRTGHMFNETRQTLSFLNVSAACAQTSTWILFPQSPDALRISVGEYGHSKEIKAR